MATTAVNTGQSLLLAQEQPHMSSSSHTKSIGTPRKRARTAGSDSGENSSPPGSPSSDVKPEIRHCGATTGSDSDSLGEAFGSGPTMQWGVNSGVQWHKLFDASMQELPPLPFRAEVDKGFKQSATHDCFICQKKNHFQVTVATKAAAAPAYVATATGLHKIAATMVMLNGARCEEANQEVGLEQSMSDRTKKPFAGTAFDFETGGRVSKVTIGRLHFTETTSNNMRKRGQPNPDQRYFSLVVSLLAVCDDGSRYTIASHISDRIIVRASNPGQFETEPNTYWVKGRTMDSIYHQGAVGINNDSPDEALCVDGNLAMTGTLIQPSDRRIKTNIVPVDPAKQLANLRALKFYHYNLRKEWADATNIPEDDRAQTGVIAQELQQLMPDAVKVTGDRTLADGSVVEKLLVVNKDRLVMEGLGAVGEMARRHEQLEQRLADLEGRNAALRTALARRSPAGTSLPLVQGLVGMFRSFASALVL